jgi:DnaJ-domain-containing protein 1
MPGLSAADLIAHFLQRRFRDPARGDAQAFREARTLGNLDVVLRLALGLPVEFRDPTLHGRGAAAELERDALFCITQCFFRDDATHYEVLGLPPDASPEAVRENFRLLMQLIHPDRQGAGMAWPEDFAARANGAYAVLKVPETRAAYDSELAEARFREQAARGVAPTRATSQAFGRAAGFRRRAVPAASLPEWLALDVGGVVRGHPVLSSLVAVVVGSASIIGVVAWEGRVATLTRETRSPVVAARPPTPDARASSPETAGPHAAALAVPTGPSPVAAAVSVMDEAPAPGVQAAAQPLPATVPAITAAASSSVPDAARPAPAAVRAAEAAPVAADRPGASPSARASAAENPEQKAPVVAAVAVAAPAPAAAASAAAEAGTATALPPATAEIEAFFAAFVESYEKGRLDSLAALFDDDAEMNLRRGRPAIRGEYDELFRLSSSRRMQLTRINWRRIGDRAHAKGEILVRIGWRDGRDVEQRIAVDMELVRRDGRALIARLSQQPHN